MNNRNYKDSVFVDLFAKDINAKENFVSLYNALHNTNLDYQTTNLEPVMIEQVLYKSFYNDIAMLIDNKIVILVEHQSTINENMPFRILEYITRISLMLGGIGGRRRRGRQRMRWLDGITDLMDVSLSQHYSILILMIVFTILCRKSYCHHSTFTPIQQSCRSSMMLHNK